MSAISNKTIDKVTYKNVVTLKEQAPVAQEQGKTIIEYDNLDEIQQLLIQDMTNTNMTSTKTNERVLPLPLRYMLSDMITSLGDLTSEIKNAYDLKGIANELKLSDVLDCFEQCVDVSCSLDKETEMITSDDDVTLN